MKTAVRVTVLLSTLVLIGAGLAHGQQSPPAVYVDLTEVEGLGADGMVPSGADLRIPIRFINIDEPRTAISNGYRFYTNGTTCGPVDAEWNPAYPWCPGVVFCDPYPCDYFFDYGCWMIPLDKGVGIAALTSTGQGLPADFDDIAYYLTVGNVQGPPGAVLTLDSTWWEPSNYWLWSGVGFDVYWGGPYEFVMEIPPQENTWCTPQPTILMESDRLLEFHIRVLNPNDVILESIRIQGQIPPYDGYPIVHGDTITTACLLTRFLGFSGFRPIPPEGVQSIYTVSFDLYSGGQMSLTGDYVLQTYQGDMNFDGEVNIEDVLVMLDYFFENGPPATLWGENMSHFMDVDASGRIDLNDISRLIEIAGI